MEQSPSEHKSPHIKVLNVSDPDDGKSELTFEVNDAFIDMIKIENNLTEISTQELNDYVHVLVMKCANKEEGYSYETINSIPQE